MRDYIIVQVTDRYGWELGEQILYVHNANACKGRACCVHNPSNHHMLSWMQNWRADKGLMERICPHGTGHPDPDDISTDPMHACDGCCLPPSIQ